MWQGVSNSKYHIAPLFPREQCGGLIVTGHDIGGWVPDYKKTTGSQEQGPLFLFLASRVSMWKPKYHVPCEFFSRDLCRLPKALDLQSA